MTSMNCLDTALELLHCHDLWPVPIKPGEKAPIGESWGLTRPTEQSIREIFRRFPNAGVGLLLGPEAGIIDIECDGPEGGDSLAKLMGGEIIVTLGWSSARGPHHVYRYDTRLARYGKSIIKLPELPGLEVRIGGNGKQLQSNCPPTIGIDGKPREWNGSQVIADPPEAMFLVLDAAMKQAVVKAPMANHGGNGASTAEKRCEKYLATIDPGVQGQNGSSPMMRAAAVIVRFGITDRNVAFRLLSGYGARCTPPWKSAAHINHKLDDAFKLETRRDFVDLDPPEWDGDGHGFQAGDTTSGTDGPSEEASTAQATDIEVPIPVVEWPDPPENAAFHELAGMIVNLIAPSTEADPVGLLLQLLVGFGNAVGRCAWVEADGCRHHANEFAVIVGETSRARKGTSEKRIRPAWVYADPDWAAKKITHGLSSGEGLIWEIRDPILGTDKKTKQEIEIDPGVEDKRVLVIESEFGNLLRVLARDGNTRSSVLRLAWDSDDLRTMTKNNPARATNPHVSLIGHITQQELLKYLASVEVFNGLGNRHLWACVRRSKPLPFGGSCDQTRLSRLGEMLNSAVKQAQTLGAMKWADSGRKLWESEYGRLTEDRPGLWGAITSRAEAHVIRLALIFTLLDLCVEIEDVHVHAALAVLRSIRRLPVWRIGGGSGRRCNSRRPANHAGGHDPD